MLQRHITILLFVCATVLAQPAEPKPALAKFAWLAGTWRVADGPMQIEERWTVPAGNMMTGMGRTLKNGDTIFFDFFRIENRKRGIFYVAQPKGQPPTDFELVSSDPNKLVFENLQHDFPKRVIYMREANGNVTARVEGTPEQAKMAEEWKYERVACGSAD
jgi:hypothetical protein